MSKIDGLANNIWDHEIVNALIEAQRGAGNGESHCHRVRQNLDRIIDHCDDPKAFSRAEMWILSACCALHDIAKSSDPAISSLVKSLPLVVRGDHGLAVEHLIRDTALKTILPNAEVAQIVAKIIGVHKNGLINGVSSTEKYISCPGFTKIEHIRPRFLAAVFRLADMLDITHSRSPLAGTLVEDGTLGTTERGRARVAGWDFHEQLPECIFFEILREDEADVAGAFHEIHNLNLQITPSQLETLRSTQVVKLSRSKKAALPYRFLSGKDHFLRAAGDVYPVPYGIRHAKSHLHYYFNGANDSINPIALSDYRIHVKADFVGKYADAHYVLKGKHMGHEAVSCVFQPIAGDQWTHFDDLGLVGTVTLKEGRRNNMTHLKEIIEMDYIQPQKLLCLSLPRELNPGEHFEIKFSFRWPGIVPPYQSYWLMDDLYVKEPGGRRSFKMEFVGLRLLAMDSYIIDVSCMTTQDIESRQIKVRSDGFEWVATRHGGRKVMLFSCQTKPD